jgi:hypothetical protein
VTRQRLGGWLIFAGVLLVCVGGIVWNNERPTVHYFEQTQNGLVSGSGIGPIPVPDSGGLSSAPIATILGRVTWLKPSHAPAIWLFVAAGLALVVGWTLFYRRTPMIDGEDSPQTG